jgi:predicted RNase H-like nuclease (RuvC/YqgF family)
MKFKRWLVNWWVIKIKDKYKERYQHKADKRIQAIKNDYLKKLKTRLSNKDKELKEQQNNYSKEIDMLIKSKEREIADLKIHYETELSSIAPRIDAKWKALLDERDETIKQLQKEKNDKREAIKELEQREQDFQDMVRTMHVQFDSFEKFMGLTFQSVRGGVRTSEKYFKKYPNIESLENAFKEE